MTERSAAVRRVLQPDGGDAARTPRFSIIMNVYNGELYLRAAIDSVLAQTLGDWEMLLYDDKSTDTSVAICQSYHDPRIRFAESDRQVPVAQAREQAIALVRGDWIAFIDQDDIWLPHKLQAQAAAIDADPPGELGLVYGRTECFDLRGRRWPFDRWSGPRLLPEGELLALLLQRPSFISLSSVVMRRDLVLPLLPMPAYVRYCPDYFLCLGVARQSRSACLQDLCTRYRVHQDNMSRRFRGPIHAEIIEIIGHAAGVEDEAVLRRRNMVHQTWIAVDEIVSGKARRRGLRRILQQGSIAYLVGRPALLVGRRLRNALDAGDWKYRLIHRVRRLGLLGLADRVKLGLARVLTRRRNQQFRRTHPDFAVPPDDLAFDAYNSLDWQHYRDGGRRQAEIFATLIARHCAAPKLRVLEWGCGPGRLIRNMTALLGERAGSLTGADYNPRTIAWCRANLPGIAFAENALLPPLPFADASFDAVYCFSVFTHLSEPVQLAWAAELRRVLAPGGLLVCTTHGDHYRYLLTDVGEQRRYATGHVVEQAKYREGRKWFFALHPPAHVRSTLLADYADVAPARPPAAAGILQDVWIARKPSLCGHLPQ